MTLSACNTAATHDSLASTTFRERRYLILRAVLSEEMVSFLGTYSDILIANNRFSHDDQCPLSLSLGGDPGFDAVLEWIRPEIERLIEIELVPTYSCVRRY